MTAYGFSRELRIPLDQALEQILSSLEDHGLHVLSIIDVKKEFKEVLDIDFKQYVILETFRSAGAEEAMVAGGDAGWVWPPCSVIIYEIEGRTMVSVIQPTLALPMIDNIDLRENAEAIQANLETMLFSIN